MDGGPGVAYVSWHILQMGQALYPDGLGQGITAMNAAGPPTRVDL
jgi:hypothetical protein